MVDSKKLSILSYNIHKGFNVRNHEFVLPQIRDAIASVQPQIVCLQEVQGKHKPRKLKKIDGPEIPQVEFLADPHWAHHIYAKNAVYRAAHHGNALLSQHPIVDWKNINVALSKRASRSLLHGIMQISGYHNRLHVICAHLGLFKAERKQQLEKLVEYIEQEIPDDEPLIIAGDFNDWRGHAEDQLESQLQLVEVFKCIHGKHAKTFPAKRPALKVDRIYFRGLSLQTACVLKDAPWKDLSDHLPLYASFELPDGNS